MMKIRNTDGQRKNRKDRRENPFDAPRSRRSNVAVWSLFGIMAFGASCASRGPLATAPPPPPPPPATTAVMSEPLPLPQLPAVQVEKQPVASAPHG